MNRKIRYPLAAAACAVFAIPAHADIATDGTTGTKGAVSVTPNGVHYEIDASYGTQQGGNLYHSFSTFNVNSGEFANFSGPADVSNVIARVTGNNYSNIDGTVSCSISNANLWLINPHGILFGKNAKLDLTGSFYASTADYLKFANNEKFYVSTQAQDSVLSVSNPLGFGFLQQDPVGIVAQQANLKVASGKQLVLAGGPITLTGSTIEASANGRVDLIAAGSPGEVSLLTTDPYTGATSDVVSVTSATRESVNLINSSVTAAGNATAEIRIVGGKFYMNAGSLLETRRQTGARSTVSLIDIRTDETTVDGGTIRTVNEASSYTQGSGIIIESTKVTVRSDATAQNKGQIISEGNGSGAYADNIAITARGTLELNRGEIKQSATNGANAGDLTIKAKSLAMLNQAAIISAAEGDSEIDNGIVSITANGIYMSGGSTVQSITRDSTSNGIHINATDVGLFDRSSISTTTQGGSKGGDINLDASNLVLRGGSSISTASTSSGAAGNLSLCGDQRVYLDHSSISSNIGSGGGGQIRIGSDNGLVLSDSQITANGNANVVVGACANNAGNTGAVIQHNSAILSKGGTTRIQAAQILQSAGSTIDGHAGPAVADTTRLLAQPESKEEEQKDKSASVRIAAFYTAGPAFQSPCASAVLKPRGSFIARDQWPVHGSPGDFLASAMQPTIYPSIALLSDAATSGECGN